MTAEVRGFLFDYGGTLDTGGRHWGCVLRDIWQQTGIPAGEELFREAYVYGERTLGSQPLVGKDFTFRQTLETKVRLEMDFLARAGMRNAAQYAEPVVAAAYEVARSHTAQSRKVLERLKNNSPLVLVSNFYGNISVILEEFSLGGLFQSVIESAAVGIRKPDARIFKMGVEALRLPAPQVTVVGDSMAKDILPARSIGCRIVWLRGEQWDGLQPDERQADRVIDRLDELLG